MGNNRASSRTVAKILPMALGVFGLLIGTPSWASDPGDEILPVNYYFELGDTYSGDQGAVFSDYGRASFGVFPGVPDSFGVHAGGENQPILTFSQAEVSYAFMVEPAPGEDDDDLPVPVDISGSYLVEAGGQGGGGVGVADNATSGGFGGNFIFTATCGQGIFTGCGTGTYLVQGSFLPWEVYSWVLFAGGQVGPDDPDDPDTMGGYYTAQIDPTIFIDNSSGKYDGYHLDIGVLTIPSSVPEPASWVLMLCGFGVLGATLRQRRLRTYSAVEAGAAGAPAPLAFGWSAPWRTSHVVKAWVLGLR